PIPPPRTYLLLSCFFLARPPTPPLFPYTTLFRSVGQGAQLFQGQVKGLAQHLLLGSQLQLAPLHLGGGLQPLQPLVSRPAAPGQDRKSTRLNSSHVSISYAVFCLKKKKTPQHPRS